MITLEIVNKYVATLYINKSDEARGNEMKLDGKHSLRDKTKFNQVSKDLTGLISNEKRIYWEINFFTCKTVRKLKRETKPTIMKSYAF